MKFEQAGSPAERRSADSGNEDLAAYFEDQNLETGTFEYEVAELSKNFEGRSPYRLSDVLNETPEITGKYADSWSDVDIYGDSLRLGFVSSQDSFLPPSDVEVYNAALESNFGLGVDLQEGEKYVVLTDKELDRVQEQVKGVIDFYSQLGELNPDEFPWLYKELTKFPYYGGINPQSVRDLLRLYAHDREWQISPQEVEDILSKPLDDKKTESEIQNVLTGITQDYTGELPSEIEAIFDPSQPQLERYRAAHRRMDHLSHFLRDYNGQDYTQKSDFINRQKSLLGKVSGLLRT